MFANLFKKRQIAKAFACVAAEDTKGLAELLVSAIPATSGRCYPGTDIKESLLLHAIDQRKFTVLPVLLSFGADPNQFNSVGVSPFKQAVMGMRTKIFRDQPHFDGRLDPQMSCLAVPEFRAVVELYDAGGSLTYHPPGYQGPVVLDVAGQSARFIAFHQSLPAWLDTQRAELRAQVIADDTPSSVQPGRSTRL